MNTLDNEFFEEYKRVDKICGDMFSCNNGISEYIRQMETGIAGAVYVPSWNNDYRSLKHCRWLRNSLAHTSESDLCVPSDIEFIKDFHNRLLALEDPLAVIEKAMKKTMKKDANVQPKRYTPDHASDSSELQYITVSAVKSEDEYKKCSSDKKVIGKILLLLAVVAVIIAFVQLLSIH